MSIKNLLSSNMGRLRIAGFLEGLSLLVLMGWAMPMKYMYDQPEYVRMVGSVHGALFIGFLCMIFIVAEQKSWKYTDIPLKLFISCFIPFGTFYLDHKLLKNEQ